MMEIVDPCCGVLGCQRMQPLEVEYEADEITGVRRWYIVTQHRDVGPDGFESMQRHEVKGRLRELLEAGLASEAETSSSPN
jgi:hypothetical protein